MFGKTVLDIDGDLFADALDAAKAARGVTADVDLDADELRELVATFQQIVREHAGREFPQHPREQLDLAIVAVLKSWNTERARLYRRRERIPDDLGTAVNVCAMVFGNLGDTSGTGVAFTRDPATGRTGTTATTWSTPRARTWSPGSATPCPWPTWSGSTRARTPSCAGDAQPGDALPRPVRRGVHRRARQALDAADPVGKRTAPAAFQIATQLVDEHLITMDEAMSRVTARSCPS